MNVSIFITCVVDQFFPQVGWAMVRVLSRLGVAVRFNPDQTCCGQPAFNTGYRIDAREVATGALQVLEHELEQADYIVIPSGSCATMIKKFYSELFAEDETLRARAERVGSRVYEFSQ